MSDVAIHPRREWTEADDAKLSEFLRKDGYDTFHLRVERMINEQNEELIAKENLKCIPAINILSTLLRVCDNARA